MSGLASALKEVLAKFEVDTGGANKNLDALDKKITSVTQTLGALTEAFVGSALVHGLAEFVSSQIEAGSVINDLSEKLGVGTDDLQAFQFATGLAGVSAESAGKALQFLNRNVGEALDGNAGAAEAFAKLGLSLKDSNGDVREAGDLIPDIADAFAGMGSDAERTAAAMKIFGKSGADLLPFLKGGSEGAKEMLAEFNRLGGGMSKGFIQAADAAGDEVDKVKFAFNGWKSQIVFAILPAVTRVSKWMQEAIGTLRRVTKETNLAKGAWVFFGAGAAAASAKAAGGFAKFLGVIPKDASFWKTVLGLGEIGLVIAAVALLYLAFDDLYTFLSGGDSIIGDVIEGLFGVGASEEVIREVNAAIDEMQAAFNSLEPIVTFFGGLLSDIWKKATPFIGAYFKLLLGSFANSIKLSAELVQFLMQKLSTSMQSFGRFSTHLGTLLDTMGVSEGKKLLELGGALSSSGLMMEQASTALPPGTITVPRPIGPPTAGTGTVNQTNNVTNNITGVKDAKAAGDAAGMGTLDALDGELADALAGAG